MNLNTREINQINRSWICFMASQSEVILAVAQISDKN